MLSGDPAQGILSFGLPPLDWHHVPSNLSREHKQTALHHTFQKIVQQADETLREIKRELKQVEKVEGGVKRGKVPCEWLWEV